MGTQVTYAPNLPEIPSEFIEPYLQRFLMMQLESVGYGLITPQQARAYLKGVHYFTTAFGAIHSRISVSNEYDRFCSLSDDDMIQIAKKCVKNLPED